jgi:phosphatidylserine decarboxylase
MAFVQIGPVSSTVGLARATIARRSTCRGGQQISSSFLRYSSTASRRAQPTPRGPGRRPYSQQSHRPRADSKVNDSKIRWYPIPVGLGVGFLGLVQFYKVYTREQEKAEDGDLDRPKKRARVRPDGPW